MVLTKADNYCINNYIVPLITIVYGCIGCIPIFMQYSSYLADALANGVTYTVNMYIASI